MNLKGGILLLEMLGRSPEMFEQHDLTIELPTSNGELLAVGRTRRS